MEKVYPQCLINYSNPDERQTTTPRQGSHHSKEGQSLDIASIIKSMQAISGEVKIDKLVNTLMLTIMENAGAQHGSLLLKHKKDKRLYIEAYKNTDTDAIEVLQSLPLESSSQICPEIIQYVARTQKSLLLNDACSSNEFCTNTYITENHVKSVLCTPINYQKKLQGIIYLENNLAADTFNHDRLKVVNILSSQAAIALENAQLYESLEEKVTARTEQLNAANEKLVKLSNQDPLTQLYNRRYIYEFFANLKYAFTKGALESSNKKNGQWDIANNESVLGIYMIDIDFFKEVNDTYGHKTGDDVLTTISAVLRNMIRSDDFIVRWGGEEFLIILNNTVITHFKRLPEKILEAIRGTPIKVMNDKTIYKTCSIGFTQVHLGRQFPDLLTLEQTINLCDYALYMAKETGRNRAVYISLTKSPAKDQKMNAYLAMLSKESKLDSNYITLEYL
jgi:histidine kinase